VEEAIARDFAVVDVPAGADGIVAMLTVRIDDSFLAAAGPQLRVVANYAVGVDNVDLEAARRRGVVVTNTPDVLTRATAELALALLLSLLRRVAEGDRFVRSRTPWRFSLEFMLGAGLEGKQLLVVGPGRIGREVGRLAEAFGARVAFAGRGDDLDALLPSADVVSVNCPSTPETHHLFDGARLARMKPSAVLVNTARGPIVDEAALVEALREGRLAGAALDVFAQEPLPDVVVPDPEAPSVYGPYRSPSSTSTSVRVDLGAEWKAWTGLPFVFAVWAARREARPGPVQEVHRSLLASRAWGLSHLDELAHDAARRTGVDESVCRAYLGDLDYALSYRHLAGLTDFFRRLAQDGLVPDGSLSFISAA